MRTLGQSLCVLSMLGLALAPAYSAETAKSAAASSAKAKAQAKAKAKAKTRARANAKAKIVKPLAPVAPAISPYVDPLDEGGLDAQVAAARRVLASKPGDAEAGARLARASVVLIDWVLRA